MDDDISPTHMDALEARARQVEDYALANARNNTATYVASRYISLHAETGYPLPVRQGTQFESPVGRLFPNGTKRLNFGIRSAHPAGGIVVSLRDENTGGIGDFHVETNGLNGVEVTSRAE